MADKSKMLIYKKRFCFFLLMSIFLGGCSKREIYVDTPENYTDGRQTTPGETLQGKIQGDLLMIHSPYRIKGEVIIDSMKTLNIEAGVKLYFEESSSLTVYGKLICSGSRNQPVVFSSYDRHWNGIIIKNSSGESALQFAVVENVDVSALTDTGGNGSFNIINSRCTIRNSVFKNNRAGNGGALYIENSRCNISNNLFVSNYAVTFGGAVVSLYSSNQFINNTFFDNESSNYGGGLTFISPLMEVVQNNIFFKNRCRTGDPSIALNYNQTSPDSYIFNYNFTQSGLSDPGFVSLNDFHLKKGSPCLDAGNPLPEYKDADGTRNDQGAYGGPLGNW